MKTCSRCKHPKSLSEFNRDSGEKDGLRSYCRSCSKTYWNSYGVMHREVLKAQSKARRLKSPEKVRAEVRRSELKCKYGLTEEDYEVMRRRQENKCDCCGEDFKAGRNQIAVDHCHKTGVVRGLLCNNCNNGLGRFKDSPDRLLRAVGYLKKFEYLSVLF